MALACGIVGLPNVGKSTVLHALSASANAQAANYPFCTIEPNVGRVAVPDARLDHLALLAHSLKKLPTFLEFVDIAGLVRGASRGEGLGNQFLGHIREVDAIIHVLRCFEDKDITHVEGNVDPLRDLEVIDTELMLADLDGLERRLPVFEKKNKHLKDPETQTTIDLMTRSLDWLKAGKSVRLLPHTPQEAPLLKQLHLVTSKPVLYVLNVAEGDAASGNALTRMVLDHNPHAVVISAAIEAEVSQLPLEEQQDFLTSLGLSETGLDRVVRGGYALLDLLTFFTVGPKEARAWTAPQGSKAPQAAGVIHTDFERGFICAETIAFDDYMACGGESGAKTAGKLRLEGKEYVMRDGDVVHFRFNV